MNYTKKDDNQERLFEHLNKVVRVTGEEFREMLPCFNRRHLNKKEMVTDGGKRCDYNHFVLAGCLHMFFIDNNGVERTIQFAIEDWWISDYLAFHKRKESDYYIQAVEDSQILSLSYENQEKLMALFPQLERYFRILYQIAYGASQQRRVFLYELSKEENYFHFTEYYPQFAQRVPQYLIASFLGLTPEYVSKIRSKKRS